MKISKKAVIATILTIVVAFAGAIGKEVVKHYMDINKPSSDIWNEVTTEINKQCPYAIDSSTRLDNVTVLNNRLTYNYTISDISVSDVDTIEFRKIMESSLKEDARTSTKIQGFFEKGIVSFNHRYRDIDGQLISDILVAKADCEAAQK